MNAILIAIADKLFALLAPKVVKLIEEKFDEWLPKIMKAIIVGTAQAAGQITVNTTDKVTDIIPGNVDDAVIDPIVRQGMDWLNGILGR